MTLSGISMLIVYALLKFFENDIPDPRYEVNSLLDNAPNKLVFWVRYPKEISNFFFFKNLLQTDQPNNRHAPPSIIVHGPPPGKH